MGPCQRAALWTVGALMTLGFMADAVDFFVFEKPAAVDIAAELGWVAVFLAMVTAVEGLLWLAFRAYNDRSAKA